MTEEQTVSKWEKNLSVPDSEMLVRLADQLDTTVDELLGAEIPKEADRNDLAEQLARINEQLAVRNHRSKRIWIAVATVFGVFILGTLLITVLGIIYSPVKSASSNSITTSSENLEYSEEEDGHTVEKFSLVIGGEVVPDEVDFSYLRADYFLVDEQCGYLYSCVDEGEDVIRLDFTPDEFAGVTDFADLSGFRVDLYLCYSDFKGDEAVRQAMYGNTGENELLTSLTIPAEYGQTYTYQLSGNRQDGYTLEEVK